MTLYDFDPWESEDLEQLRNVVLRLQKMLYCAEKSHEAAREMNAILKEINLELCQQNTLLKKQIALLETALATTQRKISDNDYQSVIRQN